MPIEVRARESLGAPPRFTEDTVTTTIKRHTVGVPSSLFLAVGLGAMGLSLICHLGGRGKWGNFIAQWVPTLLITGVYNKLVKVAGHDPKDRRPMRGEQAAGISNRPLADEQAEQRNLPPRGLGTGIGARTAV
jgi:hypothetical protein